MSLTHPHSVLRDWRLQRSGNAFYRFLVRRNRDATQVAMLLSVAFLSGMLTAFFKLATFTPEGFLIWIALRWAVGELLWAWMAADHCFTIVGRARRGGMLRELKLTTSTPHEIAAAVIHSTWLFVSVGVLLWSLAEFFIPFGDPRVFTWPSPPVALWLWIGAVPLVLAINHSATAHLASALCTNRALRPGATTATWAGSMGTLAWMVALALFPALLAAGGILAATILPFGAPEFSHLHSAICTPWRLGFLLLILAVVPPLVKYRFAARELAQAGETLAREGSDLPGDFYKAAFDQEKFAAKDDPA
ncbi:MAG: hypothetical protein RLY93_01055 [Sumerlaeia bacterium]